jgi:hypothetical protein
MIAGCDEELSGTPMHVLLRKNRLVTGDGCKPFPGGERRHKTLTRYLQERGAHSSTVDPAVAAKRLHEPTAEPLTLRAGRDAT